MIGLKHIVIILVVEPDHEFPHDTLRRCAAASMDLAVERDNNAIRIGDLPQWFHLREQCGKVVRFPRL